MFKKIEDPEIETAAVVRTSKGPSVLGPTLTFRGGELSSDEDLIIEGRVEGRIAHQSHKLTVGKTGKVKADVHAKVIVVEGTIEGNLQGDESVHIGKTGRVIGNVISPRISIEDGATFEGGIKTSPEPGTAKLDLDRPQPQELTQNQGVRPQQRPVTHG